MSDQPDLSQMMQQVGSRGMTPRPDRIDLTQAMQQVGHRGWSRPAAKEPEAK